LLKTYIFCTQVISSRSSAADGTRKSKPVAYYLPLDNLSPVRIGRRVLRDSSNNYNSYHQAATGQLSSGNRQLLANYMAGLDLAAAGNSSCNNNSSCSATADQLPRQQRRPQQLSLQDALLTQRPNFVRRAEHRRAALGRIKAARLRRAEKQEAWLEQLREMSPASRQRAEPTYSPVPQVGGICTFYISVPNSTPTPPKKEKKNKLQENSPEFVFTVKIFFMKSNR
jgi:hypothetical protein